MCVCVYQDLLKDHWPTSPPQVSLTDVGGGSRGQDPPPVVGRGEGGHVGEQDVFKPVISVLNMMPLFLDTNAPQGNDLVSRS